MINSVKERIKVLQKDLESLKSMADAEETKLQSLVNASIEALVSIIFNMLLLMEISLKCC